MRSDKNLKGLLSYGDREFIPYIEKVLNRLPENVRKGKFKITYGGVYPSDWK
jgi:hypothetical protein